MQLILDYSDGHVSPPLEPMPDDQSLANEILAKRPDGGEYRVSLESGPLSVQDPPDGVGVYQRQLDINVDSDGRLPDVAGWALHNGTWDDPHDRFPVIRTNLRPLSLKSFGVQLTGVPGDAVMTDDKAQLDITGDIDLRILLWVEEWQTDLGFVPQDLISKMVFGSDQISYSLFLSGVDGRPVLSWGAVEGGVLFGLSAQATEMPTRTGIVALRATMDVDNGSGGRTITFYTGPTLDGPWTQLGDQIVQAGTTSIFSGTAPLEIGSREGGTADLYPGVVLAARVYDGIEGTLVADPDFRQQKPGTTSFTDSTGNTWTISGDAAIVGMDHPTVRHEVGDRLTVQNLPEWLPPEDIDQVALGYTESIAVDEWVQDWNTTPIGPFRVATLNSGHVLQSDSATLAEDLDTTETGVDINCGAGPDWVYEDDFDIEIGGERMTVTAVGSMSGTFPNRTCTLTVVRSVNGIVKSHSTGAPIRFVPRVHIGL